MLNRQMIDPYRGKKVLYEVTYFRDWHFFEVFFFAILGIFGVSLVFIKMEMFLIPEGYQWGFGHQNSDLGASTAQKKLDWTASPYRILYSGRVYFYGIVLVSLHEVKWQSTNLKRVSFRLELIAPNCLNICSKNAQNLISMVFASMFLNLVIIPI